MTATVDEKLVVDQQLQKIASWLATNEPCASGTEHSLERTKRRPAVFCARGCGRVFELSEFASDGSRVP